MLIILEFYYQSGARVDSGSRLTAHHMIVPHKLHGLKKSLFLHTEIRGENNGFLKIATNIKRTLQRLN